MKTLISHNRRAPRAFTLIELLVVISIIALLAGIAVPVYNTAMLTAQENAAAQNARHIGLALHLYAGDNNGQFPNGTNSYGQTINTANDAFRTLFPNYVDNEQIFVVARSIDGPKADNNMSSAVEILKAGENHFAYVSGINSSSSSWWPVIADSTDGSGFYTSSETEAGGTWKGGKAVVVRVDNSAAVLSLSGPATKRFVPLPDDTSKNLLDVSYMGTGAKLLEPAK
ncbi:MAG: type II secretion system protein [Chthoniobacteraceae bacterium]